MATYNFGQEPDQPKEQKKKKKINIGVHFSTNLSSKPPVRGLIFGALFTSIPIIALILIFTIFNNHEGYARTIAEIIEINLTSHNNHEVFVNYSIKGEQYSHVFLPTYYSGMYVHQKINIWYNITNPYDIKLDNDKITVTVPTSICSAMIAVGVGIETYYTIKLIKSKKKNNVSTTSEGK